MDFLFLKSVQLNFTIGQNILLNSEAEISQKILEIDDLK